MKLICISKCRLALAVSAAAVGYADDTPQARRQGEAPTHKPAASPILQGHRSRVARHCGDHYRSAAARGHGDPQPCGTRPWLCASAQTGELHSNRRRLTWALADVFMSAGSSPPCVDAEGVTGPALPMHVRNESILMFRP